jgi:hypothetical protein
MTVVSVHAAGTFDVKLVPQTDADSAVGRMTIDKVFHGDIEGTSKGMMLASMSPSHPNSGAYVALAPRLACPFHDLDHELERQRSNIDMFISRFASRAQLDWNSAAERVSVLS